MDIRYILYILKDCPYCQMAKDMLEINNISHYSICFDDNLVLLENIKHAYSWNTVPIIFENTDNYKYSLVGGFTELQMKLEDERVVNE